MHVKRFLDWIGLKQKLDSYNHSAPHVTEGEIWWAGIGENVGFEINGKSSLFSRPVIIFKQLAHGFYFVIPTTSQEKNGTWYVMFKQRGKITTACLHQARAIDYRRLYSKLGELDDSDFKKVKKGFEDLYLQKIPLTSEGEGSRENPESTPIVKEIGSKIKKE